MSDGQPRNFSEEKDKFTQINVAAALARMGGDAGLLAEMAGLFVEESRALLQNLRGAVERRDAGAIEHQAHSLKGGVANFEAKEIYSLALALEKKGRERNLAGVDELFASLDRCAGVMVRELELLSQQG